MIIKINESIMDKIKQKFSSNKETDLMKQSGRIENIELYKNMQNRIGGVLGVPNDAKKSLQILTQIFDRIKQQYPDYSRFYQLQQVGDSVDLDERTRTMEDFIFDFQRAMGKSPEKLSSVASQYSPEMRQKQLSQIIEKVVRYDIEQKKKVKQDPKKHDVSKFPRPWEKKNVSPPAFADTPLPGDKTGNYRGPNKLREIKFTKKIKNGKNKQK